MRIIVALFLLTTTLNLKAQNLKWNCEELNLRFNEIPGKTGTPFKVNGCWQEETFYLRSLSCHQDPKHCLELGKNNSIKHPGGGVGSPAFSLCYNNGGRPRFVQLKIKDKWIDTSTCFFKSEKDFIEGIALLKIKP